jgi:hypothetical protein
MRRYEIYYRQLSADLAKTGIVAWVLAILYYTFLILVTVEKFSQLWASRIVTFLANQINFLAEVYPMSSITVLVFFILIAIFSIFRIEKFTFDRQKKTITLEKKEWLTREKLLVVPFNGVEMVAVSTYFRFEKDRLYFIPVIMMYLYDGSEIEVKNFPTIFCQYECSFQFDPSVNTKGAKIAEIIGCDFTPGDAGVAVWREHNYYDGTKYRQKKLIFYSYEDLKKDYPEKDKTTPQGPFGLLKNL